MNTVNSLATHGNRELEKVLNDLYRRDLSYPVGNVYFVVPSTHSAYVQFAKYYNKTYEDSTEFLQTTISAAMTASVASRYDKIYVAPGYTETVTAVKTLSKIGVSIIGLGEGNQRPLITPNGAIDVFDITAAGVKIENLRFASPGTDNQTADINVAAAGAVIRNTHHIGSETGNNKVDIITVASGGDDLLVEGVHAYNTVVDVAAFLSFEAAVARAIVRRCNVQGTFSSGVLIDEATATLALIENNLFKNTKAATAVLDFSNNSTGVCRFNHISGRHTTLASNVVAGTGMDFFENRVVEEAALNGAVIPAADTD